MNIVADPNGRVPKLAVFDVEGVLIPKNRLFFIVARSLGVLPLLKVLFYGFLYEIGLLSLKKTLIKIFHGFAGAKVEVLNQALYKMPLARDAAEVFGKLKQVGCKTALISSGLPTFMVETLASLVGADYGIGVEVGLRDGILTGEAWGDVTEEKGKFLVMKELMENEQVQPLDCVVIADDRNNASIFLKESQKIGYNPDFVIRTKADVVVTGQLSKILPVMNQNDNVRPWPSKNDFLREFIHGSGFFIPVLALSFGILPVAIFISIVVALYAVSEFARMNGKNMPFFSAVTRLSASQSELSQFATAPVYFALGILLTLLIFPAPASYAAIALFCLGDSTASLIGGTLSRKPLLFNKSKTLEGSLSGFFFAFLAASVFISPWMALLGAAIGMLVEYLPLPINDNVLIPLVSGLALTLLLSIH